MQFPHDATGQAILADVIALVALLIAMIIGIMTIVLTKPKKKRIIYDILSKKILLETDKDFQSRITSEFNINNKSVNITNLHLIKIRIWNAGDEDILFNDYIDPLNFSFKNANILEAKLLSTAPNDFKDKVQIILNNEKVIFSPPFDLKSGEEIKMDLFLSNFNGNIEGEGRIAGVRRIEHSYAGEFRYLLKSAFKISLIALGVFLSFLISTLMAFISLSPIQKIEIQITDMPIIGLVGMIWLIFTLRSEHKGIFSIFWSIILITVIFILYILLRNTSIFILFHLFPGH